MSACPLVVLACESLHVCTVCIWRCEHAWFCVEGFYALYINFHSFIHYVGGLVYVMGYVGGLVYVMAYVGGLVHVMGYVGGLVRVMGYVGGLIHVMGCVGNLVHVMGCVGGRP